MFTFVHALTKGLKLKTIMEENQELTAEQSAKIISLSTAYIEVITNITARLYADYQSGRLSYFKYSQRLTKWENEYNRAKAIINDLTPKPAPQYESEAV